MIKGLKYREKTKKLPRRFSLHHESTTLPLRALISATSFRIEWLIPKERLKNRIDKKIRNRDGTKIILKKMRSERSKDQRDRFSKGDGWIQWSQYHRMDSICILQCNYSSFQVTVRTRSSCEYQNSKFQHRKSKT